MRVQVVVVGYNVCEQLNLWYIPEMCNGQLHSQEGQRSGQETDLAVISMHRWWKSQEAEISQGQDVRRKGYRNTHRSLGSVLYSYTVGYGSGFSRVSAQIGPGP